MVHQHPRPRRRVAVTLLALVAVGALVAGACSSMDSKALLGATTTTSTSTTTPVTTQPPGLQPPPGFRIPDTRAAVLVPVKGTAGRPVPIPVLGGHATVSGVVRANGAPVGGATVRVERFVGLDSGAVTVTADGAGRFAVGGALGGRYRVRAWLQPALATLDAPTGFVADGDQLTLDIDLERHDAVSLQVGPAVDALVVGVSAGVNALLTQETVDGNGIVQTVGLGGVALTLTTDGALAVTGANPATTDGSGRASWALVCQTPGSYSVGVSGPNVSGGAALPACTLPAPSTTAPSSTSTTGP